MTHAADPLTPGQHLTRADLHRQYGGRLQGRVSPSVSSKAVFLFTPETNGVDGWQGDTYLFLGEGHSSDQTLTQGNKAVFSAAGDGRRLVLLKENGEDVICAGVFMLNDPAMLELDLPDPTRKDGAHRTTFVFRLRPQHPQGARDVLRASSTLARPVRAVTVTALDVATALPEDRSGDAFSQVTLALTRDLAAHLASLGHRVICQRIEIPGEAVPLYGRLYDQTEPVLYDAVPTATRDRIREAIGRLLDVTRFLPASTLALLCPSEPRASLLELLHASNITAVWPAGDGYHRSAPPHSRQNTA